MRPSPEIPEIASRLLQHLGGFDETSGCGASFDYDVVTERTTVEEGPAPTSDLQVICAGTLNVDG